MADTRTTHAGQRAAADSVDKSVRGGEGGLPSYPTSDNSSEHAAATWRNPPHVLRIGLVAAVWMLPGVLLGLMTALVVPFASDPATAGFVGAVLGGAIGAWIEARG